MKSISELRALRKVYIGGLGQVPFQRYEDQEYYDFASQALLNCLDESEMEWKEIEAGARRGGAHRHPDHQYGAGLLQFSRRLSDGLSDGGDRNL
ncbi:MAG: hypothetical protein HY787_24615 [Deltaproteobacteria bacterium]|nr:hypothetical protein [Deltaproteobacteria bacterium]